MHVGHTARHCKKIRTPGRAEFGTIGTFCPPESYAAPQFGGCHVSDIQTIEYEFRIVYIGASAGAVRAAHQDRTTDMTLDRTVMAFAGFMTLLSVVLTYFVSPLFLWFTVFIGFNLIQSSFTGFCPAAMVFRKLGVKNGCAFE